MKSPPDSYAAVVGDSKMLAVLSPAGEIVRLFWPHVDYGQHVEKFRVGLKLTGRRRTLWLDDSGWAHWQTYVESTNVLITESKHEREINLSTTASVLPGCDALALGYSLRNEGKTTRDIKLLVYENIRIDESPFNNTAIFDESAPALIFYSRDTAVATYSSRPPSAYHIGVEGERSSALNAANTCELNGAAIQHKSPDAVVAWDLGPIYPGDAADLTVFVALAGSYREAISDAADFAAINPSNALYATKMYWRKWITGETPEHGRVIVDAAPEPPTPPRHRARPRTRSPIELTARALGQFRRSHREKIARLFERSLLAIKLLSDRETGAIIAAPEFDREREACGGYGYTWGRDGAFIAHAMGLAGFPNEAEAFFAYARGVQEPGGAWLHRHYSSGQLASSWGLLQIDETGAIIWAMAQHYRITGSRGFLRECSDSIERGVNYLIQVIDQETGLPIPNFDLWEEDICESIYAAAAVTAGIAAAAECAAALGSKTDSRAWAKKAGELRQAIIQRLWDPKRRTFLRAVKKVVSEESFAAGWKRDRSNFYMTREDGRMYDTFYQAHDSRIDSSMLGLVYPFGIFGARDPMMRGMARSVRQHLWWKPTGGILRYEGDRYVGGNPWILTTLWLALYHIEAGETTRAARLIEWAADHATETDLLTEQVDKKTGKPIWAVPLAWSHAMFLLAALKIGDKA